MEEWSQGNERLYNVLQKLFPNLSRDEKIYDLDKLTKAYHDYKMKYLKPLSFTPYGEKLCKYMFMIFHSMVSATMLDHNPLEAVYIYFDTATYDEIEKDKKVIFDMSLPFHGLAMLVGQSAYFFYI